jgi:hypothetical protein
MTQHTKSIDLPFHGARHLSAQFDATPITSDGGAPLLAALDKKLGLVDSLVQALTDRRDIRYTDHSLTDLIRQRVFQIALGYEDCNDADTLRHDPVLKAACGRDPVLDPDLASQPTLSRLENSIGPKASYRLARNLFQVYLAGHPKRPKEIILDLDLTDDPTHGQQELSFFHGYYDSHVYLPLLVFDGDGELMTAVLLPGKNPGAGPVVAVLKRLVESLREHWPEIEIMVRADAGFASPLLYHTIESASLKFLIGLRSNPRLERRARKVAAKARRRYLRTKRKARLFTSTSYRAKRGWPKSYRVVIKAEHMAEGPNVRYVLTNQPGRADALYDRYVMRGESCENSIKDLKNALRADRLSCHRFWANQFRLLLHAAAFTLLFALRRHAAGTELADAQLDTIRLRLLKIGAYLVCSVRRLRLHLSSSHPWQKLWFLVARRIMNASAFG